MNQHENMRPSGRTHCGVCGEIGNHGDYPHDEAVKSRFNQVDALSLSDREKRDLEITANSFKRGWHSAVDDASENGIPRRGHLDAALQEYLYGQSGGPDA